MNNNSTVEPDAENPFRFFSVCVSVPNPAKRKAYGEDAAFMTNRSLGVFDGVGSWARKNIDAGAYSKQLSENCKIAATREEKAQENLVARSILAEAVNLSNKQGSSTAIVAALNNNTLSVCNLGDCMVIVLRNGNTIFESLVQVHSFNKPHQVAYDQRDDLRCASVSEVQVDNFDIIVMGSDGVWDNLSKETVIGLAATHAKRWRKYKHGNEPKIGLEKKVFSGAVHKILENEEKIFSERHIVLLKTIAFEIASWAFQESQNKHSSSPYAQNARNAGRKYTGGKPDDITVLVAIVLRSRAEYRSMYTAKC